MTQTTKQHGWLTALAAAFISAAACSSTSTPTVPSMPVAEVTAASTPTPTPASEPTPTAAPLTARYHVTFDATWSASSHPLEFPSSAHFSPLIGATHTAQVAFWREGGAASDGIIDMAERGLTTRLSNEINGASPDWFVGVSGIPMFQNGEWPVSGDSNWRPGTPAAMGA